MIPHWIPLLCCNIRHLAGFVGCQIIYETKHKRQVFYGQAGLFLNLTGIIPIGTIGFRLSKSKKKAGGFLSPGSYAILNN